MNRQPPSTTRTYRQKGRATKTDTTRQRIVDAAIEEHQEKGALATITSIAEKAGVGRVTVYRHFPDERALLAACTSHYLEEHQPPDPVSWDLTGDPADWFPSVVAEIFAYHQETQLMMAQAEVVTEISPVLADLLQPMYAFWEMVRDLLASRLAKTGQPDPSLTALIGHLTSFTSWQALTADQSLDQQQASDLVSDAILAIAK